MEDFFAEKENIAHVFSLADIRHDPTADDLAMINFLYYHRIPFTVVATKADKLNATDRKKSLEALRSHPLISEHTVIPFSALSGEGVEECRAALSGLAR